MDNNRFNVKGEGYEFLKQTLELAFNVMEDKPRAYRIDKKKGFVLYWTDTTEKSNTVVHPFPTTLTAEQLFPLVQAFLESDEADEIELSDGDEEFDDCDVDNYYGWRVYTESWGRVDGDAYAFLAITPSWCWSGK